MIVGTGIDLCQISRIAAARRAHGARFDARILTPAERAQIPTLQASADRFVAKRFAAKEALGKALGRGMRTPMSWQAAEVVRDTLGQPAFEISPAMARLTLPRAQRVVSLSACTIHLSLSDDGDYALAQVLIEHTDR